jgi:hypothetical protein
MPNNLEDGSVNLEAANLWEAKQELEQLNAEAARGRVSTSSKVVDALIVIEVSKAVTLASLRSGIEARVLCTNVRDMCDAMKILAGAHCSKELKGVWNSKERTLEFPNGSAVVVKFQPAMKTKERQS